MQVENRDWGQINPVDYVPFIGVIYRCYWCVIARRGKQEGKEKDDWGEALRGEGGRLFVALFFTAAVVVFVALGGTGGETSPALVPALTVALGGVFLHRLLSIAGTF